MSFLHINYDEECAKIGRFIETFHDDQKKPKYVDYMKRVSKGKQDSILIELDDIKKFFPDDSIVESIEKNTRRYHTLFCRIIDPLIPESRNVINDESSPVEVMIAVRKQLDLDRENSGQTNDADNQQFPPELTRKYVLNFKPLSTQKPISVRNMLPSMLGGLVTLKGMVTRVSNVKPLATVLAMSCERCGSEMFQGVSSSSVMPLFDCQSNDCKRNNTRGKLVMQTRGSKFLKFQEVKVQELTEQVPMGHIPRSMSVHLYENLARSVNPGDSVTISGIFLPIPYVGFKAIRAGLLTDTFLEAHHIVRVKEQYNSMVITSDMRTKIEELARKDMYQKLSKSIAPEIWGHDDVKKALLLQLIGGSSKETHDGMKIRGDLNICLMGDPGVAKSQLLKHICKIAPRSAYTTGRGSSGVGLTASVIKDPVTDELVLEGGALVLADNGIACIDEFDKMDENDRTAIHEVMEQQTISISKAGITTTLNARTSILAAANPLYGRYNTDKKATENINLPAALLSRFDLLFLILDKPSIENDLRLAKHVSYVHIHNTHPPLDEANEDIVDIPLLKHCISLARTFSPVLPPEVGEYLVHTYIMMRERFEETSDFQYTSARTLLSIIRISTALARLRFSNFVAMADVDEAIRLNDVSKASLLNQGGAKKSDPMSIIYDTILQMSKNNVDGKFRLELKYGEILEKVKIKGFSEENLLDCIRENEENEIWILTGQGSKLKWLLIDE